MLSKSGVQRAAQDAGRAAGAREVPAGDHRSAEAAGDRAVALPAVQPEAAGRGADRRADRARSCRPRASRPSRRDRAARRVPPTAACATACRCSTRRSPTPAAAQGPAARGAAVDAMLGTVDRTQVGALLDGAGGGRRRNADGGDRSDWRSSRRTSATCLMTLAEALHRIQLYQLVPSFAGEEPTASTRDAFARQLSPELVQLWYQMAVNGRRDLGLAPSPRAGFEMACCACWPSGRRASGRGHACRRCRRPRAGAVPAAVAPVASAPRPPHPPRHAAPTAPAAPAPRRIAAAAPDRTGRSLLHRATQRQRH